MNPAAKVCQGVRLLSTYVSSVGEPLVQQDISVPGPVQSLDPIGPAAAEQEQALLVQVTAELLDHDSG